MIGTSLRRGLLAHHSRLLPLSRSSACVGRCCACPACTSRSLSSSAQPVDDRFFPVYVHHVSKTVLQHLQESRADWLVEEGLDKGLRLNSNGTFVLQFPARKGFDAGRIWTSYDVATKQHWLSVYRHKLLGRFLLKDTSMTRSQSFAEVGSKADAEIRSVVDDMIATLNKSRSKAR